MLLDAGHVVRGEIVGIDARAAGDARQDIAAEVGVAQAARLLQQLLQRRRIEQIVTHRGEDAARVAGNRRRRRRLLAEVAHPAVGAGRDDAERGRVLDRHRHAGDRHLGVAGPVEGRHLP